MKRLGVGATLVVLLGGFVSTVGAQPSLTDFGYQHRKTNGVLPLGSRPLLVLRAVFQGEDPIAHGTAYYDSLVYPLFGNFSVNGFFFENSSGRFFWSRPSLGIPDTVVFTSQENLANRLDNPQGISYVLREIIKRRNLDLSGFDGNGDHKIMEEELGILLLTNQGDGFGGAARQVDPTFCAQLEGTSYQICGGGYRITIAGDLATFSTICHELTHQLGALDLYGNPNTNCWSRLVTLMSCTGGAPDQPLTYHLDPWHKLQLGWIEPRIRSLKAGGVESLPAAQLTQTDGPVILYDPAKGAAEFFIVEYRTTNSPNGPGYDASTSGSGMALWHVQQDANKEPTLIAPLTYGVFHEGAFTLSRGGSALWNGPNTTPVLAWMDGTPMTTRIVIHDFTFGAGAITVEWLTDDEMWVDFNYVGPELGTFGAPFRTLAAGEAATPRGGRLTIKAGSTSAAQSFQRPMRVSSYGGTATLGQ